MELKQILYAIEIADTGSISQAAHNLYLSQPNLSHSIKQLEKEIGFPLFVRTSSGVIPTNEGRTIIERFRVLQQDYQQIQSQIYTQQKFSNCIHLHVGILNDAPVNTSLIKITERYIDAPIYFSFFHFSYLEELLPQIETCQIDFAIIGTTSINLKNILVKFENSNIEYHAITDVPICALIGSKNPLYQCSSVSTQELYPYPIVQFGTAAEDPNFVLPHVIGLSPHAQRQIRVNRSSLFYDIIKKTSAVGLIGNSPEIFLHQNEHPGIHPLYLSDCNVTAQIGWIKNQRLPLPEIAFQLLSQIQEELHI